MFSITNRKTTIIAEDLSHGRVLKLLSIRGKENR